MSFLSSIGRSLGGIIKQVAPMAIKAIAGPAGSLLRGVVGDLFTKGSAALTKLAGNLPGPLGSLAQRLLGSALPRLQNMAMGGLEKLIQTLASSITSRFAPGAGNVTPDAIQNRAGEIAANNPVAAAQAAATSAAQAATAATSAAASGTTSGVNSSNPAPSGSDLPPSPLTGKDAEDIGKQNDFNAKMQSYQARLSAMNKYWEMISNIYKAHDQTKSTLVSNLR